jgi:hypothetical protein
MSLRWDVSNVKDFETVCYVTVEEDMPMRGLKVGDEVIHPVTEALVWHTIGIGMGEISDENAADFYARVSLVETLFGASVSKGGEPKPITREDVLAHVGLFTNASAETLSSFLKRQSAEFHRAAKGRFETKRAVMNG